MDKKYKIILIASIITIILIFVYFKFFGSEKFTDLVGYNTGKKILISDDDGNITMYPLDNIANAFRGVNGDLNAEITRINGILTDYKNKIDTLYKWTDNRDAILNSVFPNGDKNIRLAGDNNAMIERTHLLMLNGLYPLNLYNKTMGPGSGDSKDGGSVFANGRGDMFTRAKGRVENGVLGAQLMLEPW